MIFEIKTIVFMSVTVKERVSVPGGRVRDKAWIDMGTKGYKLTPTAH